MPKTAHENPRHLAGQGGRGDEVSEREYRSKEELESMAKSVLNELKPKRLPVWQVKEVLRQAIRLADWTIME